MNQVNVIILAHFSNNPPRSKKSISQLSYIIAKQYISKYFSESEILIQKSNNGKPFINDSIHLSISHSSNCIAIALSTHNVGVDLEDTSKLRNIALVSNNISNAIDKKILPLSSSKQLDFYYLWTKKEAVLKYYGLQFTHKILKDLDITNTSTKLYKIDGIDYCLSWTPSEEISIEIVDCELLFP
jgi:phosphopantetheinyl transferase